jgi:hypothetical protein
MRYDNRQNPISYICGVLIDGARPFLYRSRACSLLGVPESKIGKQRPPRILLSINSRSTNHKFHSEQHVDEYSVGENERSRIASESKYRTNLAEGTTRPLHCNKYFLDEKEITIKRNAIQEKPITAKNELLTIETCLPSKSTSEMKTIVHSVDSHIEIHKASEKQKHVSGKSFDQVRSCHDSDIQTENNSTAKKDVFTIEICLPSKSTSEMKTIVPSVDSHIEIHKSPEEQKHVTGKSIHQIGSCHDPERQTDNTSTAKKDVFTIETCLPSRTTSEIKPIVSSIESHVEKRKTPEEIKYVSEKSIETVSKYHDPEVLTENASYLGNRPTKDIKIERIEITGVSSKSQITPRSVQFNGRNIVKNAIEGRQQKHDSTTVLNDHLFSDGVVKVTDDNHLIQNLKNNKQYKKTIKKSSVDSIESDAWNPPVIDIANTLDHIGEDEAHNESTFMREAEIPFLVKKNKETYDSECGDVPCPAISHHTLKSHSNENAAERIEQLRHAVNHLVSKISSTETKNGATTSEDIKQRQIRTEQAQSRPIQKIVIIKQHSQQVKTPHAFWERSYLSRFRLRLLR